MDNRDTLTAVEFRAAIAPFIEKYMRGLLARNPDSDIGVCAKRQCTQIVRETAVPLNRERHDQIERERDVYR